MVTNARPEDVPDSAWDVVALVVRLLTIGAGAWLLATALIFVEDLGLSRYDTGVADNRVARRAKTQGLIIRRLTVADGGGGRARGGALQLPRDVQAVGTSLLASAGIIGIVAAVAAQSTLANLIAGLQVAFSDAIRLDDVVIVEDEWGWIEEITLSLRRRPAVGRPPDGAAVDVLHQDARSRTGRGTAPSCSAPSSSTSTGGSTSRPCAPSSTGSSTRTELWDGRTKVLQVTDAVGGLVRVRVLVTATDAATLFDLRCHVREELVTLGAGPRPATACRASGSRWSSTRSAAPARRRRAATGPASSPATPPARRAPRASARASRRTPRPTQRDEPRADVEAPARTVEV